MSLPRVKVEFHVDHDVYEDMVACAEFEKKAYKKFAEEVLTAYVKKKVADAIQLAHLARRLGKSGEHQ